MRISTASDDSSTQNVDPWNYVHSPDDDNRKAILLSELPSNKYQNVLSIGCGSGFITSDLPGRQIIGIDSSKQAILKASEISSTASSKRVKFIQGSILELPQDVKDKSFDLIVITGVLYSANIGRALNLVYLNIDAVLSPDGIIASAHIADLYHASFPYLSLKSVTYNYREHNHILELYVK